MKTERFTMNTSLASNRTECSVAALSKRLLEGPLKLAEVVELSEKCGLREVGQHPANRKNQPFTFVVPAVQQIGSISRYVE
jgi:hypothetical protein